MYSLRRKCRKRRRELRTEPQALYDFQGSGREMTEAKTETEMKT